jgi:hypothetical protein
MNMGDNSNVSRARKYEVALSFAGEDRQYVERVASELVRTGVSVFYDRYEEAALWGKNLYDHLRHIYTEAAEYTVMFVSAAYADKLWTNHERESAQSRVFGERREYILPARFDDTEVPGLLKTTGYIDLRHKAPEELAALIIEKLGRSDVELASTEADRLRKNSVFAAALQELESAGSISYAISDAIVAEESPPDGLSEFLLILVKESQGYARLSLGKFAIDCIDKFNIGYEAIEYCLEKNALEDSQRDWLGMHMQYITRPEVISWAHERLTRDIRSDTYYNSFITKHLDFVLNNLAAEMTAYLLVPNRGPVNYNIDSLFLVAKAFSKPTPFVRRIRDWIYNGNFDGATRRASSDASSNKESTMGATLLYRYLNELTEFRPDHPLQSLRSDVCDRTRALLKLPRDMITGLYHLYVMRTENFVDIDAVLNRVYELDSSNDDEHQLFSQLRTGIGFDELGETRVLARRLGLF